MQNQSFSVFLQKPFAIQTALVMLLTMLVSAPAHAYLDPGTGSAIIQGILAAFAALALTARLYWYRLLRLLGLRKDRPTEQTRAKQDDDLEPGRADRTD